MVNFPAEAQAVAKGQNLNQELTRTGENPMTRKPIFIAVLAAAMAIPAVASANCGTIQGSFAVTCEQGVQVYRHQALSSIPRGLSQADAQIEAEKIRAETAQRSIEAQERADIRANNQLRRELALEDYRSRIFDRALRNNRRSFGLRNSGFGFGTGFGGGFNSGIGLVQPIRVQQSRRNRSHK